MGLIRAALGSATGAIADQFKDYFYCESIPADVLVLKGKNRNSGRSGNTGRSSNVISDGSIINVADGQCMMIVESGKIVDLCSEPGEFTYDTTLEPSIFCGELNKESLKVVFEEMGKRFAFGGEPPKDQRIYYFNMKEIMGNKYGTPAPVPFRVVDQRAGIDIDIGLRCFGEYSFKIINPMLLYTNIAGNVEREFTRQEMEGQMRSELLTALQPAFAKLSAMGIRYSAIPAYTKELTSILQAELSATWGARFGLELVTIAMSSIKASEEDEAMIKELQRNAAFTDPSLAMAYTVGMRGQAMKDAANNPGGAAVGFMGMNMAGGMGGADSTMQALLQMQQLQQAQQMQAQQGVQAAQPQQPVQQPAAPAQPAADGWTCSCGTFNKGKFCCECGSPKPAGAPQYKCDKCGWEPEKGSNPPKFCPECGDRFDNDDIV